MAERITLTLHVGSHASITALGSAVDDVRRVLEFAAAWQLDVDRRVLTAQRLRSLRRPDHFSDSFAFDPSGRLFITDANLEEVRPLDSFERMAYREANENAQITVTSMKYENPLELVIIAGGAVVLGLLAMIRDWPDRQRLNRSVARDYENSVIARERVRNHVVKEIEAGRLPLPSQAIEALLTDDVANSLSALGDGGLDVRGLPPSSSASDEVDEN